MRGGGGLINVRPPSSISIVLWFSTQSPGNTVLKICFVDKNHTICFRSVFKCSMLSRHGVIKRNMIIAFHTRTHTHTYPQISNVPGNIATFWIITIPQCFWKQHNFLQRFGTLDNSLELCFSIPQLFCRRFSKVSEKCLFCMFWKTIS